MAGINCACDLGMLTVVVWEPAAACLDPDCFGELNVESRAKESRRLKSHCKGDGKEKDSATTRGSKVGRAFSHHWIFWRIFLWGHVCLDIKTNGEMQAGIVWRVWCAAHKWQTQAGYFGKGVIGHWFRIHSLGDFRVTGYILQCHACGSSTLGMKLISQPSKGKEKGSHCTSAVVSVMVLNFSPCGVARSGREQGVVSRAGWVCICCYTHPFPVGILLSGQQKQANFGNC